ncbi:MAG: hypothetical protein ACKVWR_00190 [Acidimicrobiales bacterium]
MAVLIDPAVLARPNLSDVVVVVHEIDVETHPSCPPGWRWCVQLGGAPYDDARRWLNAGWEPSERLARLAGEQVATAIDRAFALLGVRPPAPLTVVRLDADPCPPE